ncbi:MAG: DUF5403 family protein [Stackebrandtia sp.]
MAKVKIHKRLDAKVARLPIVRERLDDVAGEIVDAAKTLAEPHRRTGEYIKSIQVTRGKLDSYATATADHSAAVEWGHHAPDGRWVGGQHIMARAAARVSS